MSGQYSYKVKPGHMTKSEHNWSITSGLESWGKNIPILSAYIKARKEYLPHAKPGQKILDQEAWDNMYKPVTDTEHIVDEIEVLKRLPDTAWKYRSEIVLD